jgi:hypothetical protein
MLLAWVTLSAAAAGAKTAPQWSFPLSLTADEMTAVCGRDGTILEYWLDADLRYDPATDGIEGAMKIGVDVWLRDAAALASGARINKSIGPLSRCRRIDIEIWSPTDGRTRRLDDGDLNWRGELEASGGIVHLDVTDYMAVIPGLRIGDRLRQVWHVEWSRYHGLPFVDLGQVGDGPVRSSVRLSVPQEQQLTFQYVGSDSLAGRVRHSVASVAGRRVATWDIRDVRTADSLVSRRRPEALTLVPHLSVADAGRPKTAFAGAGTWVAAASAYRERMRPFLEPSPEVAAQARQVVAGESTVSARIAALYRHVQKTTRYLGLYNGTGGVIPAGADATRQAGYGDCKGLSCYFIALCRAVDIEAWPVLVLADEERALAVDQPNLTQFNHFIAWVDDGEGGCWIDPTLEDLPAGVLVPLDALQPVLSSRPGAEGLCHIPREAWAPGTRRVEVAGAIDDALCMQATVTLTADGPGGEILAAGLSGADPRRQDTMLREILLASALRSTVVPAADGDTNITPLTWRRTVRAAQPLPGDAGRRFLAAEIANVPEFIHAAAASGNPIDPRRHPDRTETWRIDLPAGWRLAEPDSFSVSAPGLVWTRSVRQSGQQVLLTRFIDWGDSAIAPADEILLTRALAEAANRDRSPFQLRRQAP